MVVKNDRPTIVFAPAPRMDPELELMLAALRDGLPDARHDLRTPLTSLKGHAQLLRRYLVRGKLDEERLAVSLSAIERETEELGKRIDALLDAWSAQLGRMRPPADGRPRPR